MKWLKGAGFDYDELEIGRAALAPLPIAATEVAVVAKPVRDNGEPLAAVDERLPVFRPYLTLGFRHCPSSLYLREGVISRLVGVATALPTDFDLVLLDGWRSRVFQQELLEYYREASEGSIEGYVADPKNPSVIPGHVTGGAVDLTLSYRGQPLALGSDYDEFSERAHLGALESETSYSTDAKLRRLLGGHLTAAGFAPYPLEWWHWSYGDQRWAAQVDARAAVYGEAVSPPGVLGRP